MPTKVLFCDTGGELAQLQYFLMKSGADLEFEMATDGFRAVELAGKIKPATVVTEIDLKGLGGAELIGRFLDTVPEVRVICHSRLSTPEAAAEALGAGAAAYVLKQDGPEAILRAIRAALDGNITISAALVPQLAASFADAVSSRRQLEDALSEAHHRVEGMNTAKAEFLANVSHELRTPVTVAKGIAYVLKNRAIPPEDQNEFLEKLESSLEKLMMIVDEILTIAELDRGTLSLKVSNVDLAPLLRHVSDEINRQYPETPIERTIPDSLPAIADPVRISEVVRQLMDNACRYSPSRQPVQLRARALDEGVVVSVTDRGQGIPREVVHKAFNEPFSTGEEVLRKERAGVGVGLHLARQLILQHGGIIWADPLPAGGSRVSFCLPSASGQTVTARPELMNEPASHPTATAASS